MEVKYVMKSKQRIILIAVLIIFLTGMLCAYAAEPVDAAKYVGSKKSNKYHKKTCASAKKIKKSNKIVFKSKKQAKRMGYKPCKKCHP